jgi:hypothetical protein
VELAETRYNNKLLESQLSRFMRESEEERDRLVARVQELERTIRDINASKSWKLVSFLRRLAGRGW